MDSVGASFCECMPDDILRNCASQFHENEHPNAQLLFHCVLFTESPSKCLSLFSVKKSLVDNSRPNPVDGAWHFYTLVYLFHVPPQFVCCWLWPSSFLQSRLLDHAISFSFSIQSQSHFDNFSFSFFIDWRFFIVSANQRLTLRAAAFVAFICRSESSASGWIHQRERHDMTEAYESTKPTFPPPDWECFLSWKDWIFNCAEIVSVKQQIDSTVVSIELKDWNHLIAH